MSGVRVYSFEARCGSVYARRDHRDRNVVAGWAELLRLAGWQTREITANKKKEGK